ncbi:hypothetical protein HD806DRAFT_541986 [Xylariaceae sp. AK1471]|nr:hypothetical protein HD806DRAFT_541986 [Xylariaceae sp. AK1471]
MVPFKNPCKFFKNRRAEKRNGGFSVAASPDSPGAPSIDSRKPLTSNLKDPHVSPNLPASTVQVALASDEPSKPVVVFATKAILNASFHLAAKVDPGAEERQLVMNPRDQQMPKHSASQRLWNAAYDDLEQDENTAELVRSYATSSRKL